MYSLNFREDLDAGTTRELEALVARLKSFLLHEHNEDGTHNYDLMDAHIDERIRAAEQRGAMRDVISKQSEGQWWTSGPWLLDGTTSGVTNRSVIDPPALAAGTYHNYTPAGIDDALVVNLNPTGNIVLTGLKPLLGQNQPRLLVLHNLDGTNTITLNDEDVNSSPAYRFLLPAATRVLGGRECVWLFYGGDEGWAAF